MGGLVKDFSKVQRGILYKNIFRVHCVCSLCVCVLHTKTKEQAKETNTNIMKA